MTQLNEEYIRNLYQLIECPNQTCKNQMCIEPGEVDLNLKDNEGKVMTKQAATHYALQRV